MFIPVLYLSGKAPSGDDVTMFLDNSNAPPVLVSILALFFIAFLLVFALKLKKIYLGYLNILKGLKDKKDDAKL